MALFVNGEEVPEGLLQAETQGLRARFAQLTHDQRVQFGFDQGSLDQRAVEWARENVIERVLLRQEALQSADEPPEEAVQKTVESMKQRFGGDEKLAEAGLSEETLREEAVANLKVEQLITRLRSRAKAPKSKELAAWYRKNIDRFKVGETVHAAHIVKHVNEETAEEQALEAIEAAKAELDKGAKFEELADQASDCPGNGGDLGWFGRGKMVEKFEDIVFTMQPGQVSGVFKTQFGFHIAKLYEKKPETTRPLHEVKAEVEREVRQERENQAVEEFVDGLRAKAKIEELEATTAG